MNEDEWLACKDPKTLLEMVEEGASERKLRLLAIAGARLFWDRIPTGPMREAVEVAERYAEGYPEGDTLKECRNKLYDYVTVYQTDEQRKWYYSGDNKDVHTMVFSTTSPNGQSLKTKGGSAMWSLTMFKLGAFLSPFVRELFGNPFRPVALNPNWLTNDVVLLAQGIYDERAFDRMPILYDALMDAGCTNPDVLGHCRQGEHVRGCWVIDLLLGKS